MESGGIGRMLQLGEAVAAIALSHPEACPCAVCRAAGGDQDALAELLIALDGTKGEPTVDMHSKHTGEDVVIELSNTETELLDEALETATRIIRERAALLRDTSVWSRDPRHPPGRERAQLETLAARLDGLRYGLRSQKR